MTEEKQASTTKDRILDAAEHLFAEQGFDTSLRDITAAAGVNLAAINYHFQSKDALIMAVFSRRVRPLNDMRLAKLDELEGVAAGRPIPLEDLTRAFISPMLELLKLHKGSDAARLIGRMFVEPGNLFQSFFRQEIAPVADRFRSALMRTLPEEPEVDIFWKFLFAAGVVGHTVAGLHKVEVISGGLCDITDTQALLDRAVAFIAAGFRAPYQPAQQGEPSCNASR